MYIMLSSGPGMVCALKWQLSLQNPDQASGIWGMGKMGSWKGGGSPEVMGENTPFRLRNLLPPCLPELPYHTPLLGGQGDVRPCPQQPPSTSGQGDGDLRAQECIPASSPAQCGILDLSDGTSVLHWPDRINAACLTQKGIKSGEVMGGEGLCTGILV